MQIVEELGHQQAIDYFKLNFQVKCYRGIFRSHLASTFFKCLGWKVPAIALLPRKVV
jgi:hypothetical protein